MRTKSIGIAILLFTLTVFLNSCTWFDKGISDGFQSSLSLKPLPCGYKGETTDYQKDDVTLDFYFGHGHEEHTRFLYRGHETVCFALYFCEADVIYDESKMGGVTDLWGSRDDPDVSFEDYRGIEGYKFVKEIGYEEFATEEYGITYSGFLVVKLKFRHHEKFTVPAELFHKTEGKIIFRIAAIVFNKEKNNYFIGESGYMSFDYQTKENDMNAVTLSKRQASI
ncbi:MAG: hypothetical protein LBP62_01150 [Clostridiales bacterium]|nr:hypothetical protein [Clostridiales bacterium]